MNGNVNSCSQLSVPSSAESNGSIFDFNEDQSHQSRTEKDGHDDENNNKLVIHDNDDCKTPEGGRVSLVSSKTSLSAARHFFRKLDKEHHLVITTESESPTPNRQRRAIVTKRGGTRSKRSSYNNLQLDQEYTAYKAACEASSVSPLPKTEYVRNRGAYFRSTELYDGLLDE